MLRLVKIGAASKGAPVRMLIVRLMAAQATPRPTALASGRRTNPADIRPLASHRAATLWLSRVRAMLNSAKLANPTHKSTLSAISLRIAPATSIDHHPEI